MKIDILTLFPEMVSSTLNASIIGKAIEKNILEVNVVNFRDYAHNKHNSVDDYPYGGGAGMLLQPQPIFEAMDEIKAQDAGPKRVILLDPAGKQFDEKMAVDFSNEAHLTFICGHYEGYDERIRSLVTDEVSLGDYILTGGELGALVMIDATARLLPGVLGNETSASDESFNNGLLEYPQYTRPAVYRDQMVPDVLLSGNHQKIAEWREKEALRRTFERRPDLLEGIELSSQQQKWLREFRQN